jgi:hypothetical protein
VALTNAQRQTRKRAKQAAEAGSLHKKVDQIQAEVSRLRELLEPTKVDIARTEGQARPNADEMKPI